MTAFLLPFGRGKEPVTVVAKVTASGRHQTCELREAADRHRRGLRDDGFGRPRLGHPDGHREAPAVGTQDDEARRAPRDSCATTTA